MGFDTRKHPPLTRCARTHGKNLNSKPYTSEHSRPVPRDSNFCIDPCGRLPPHYYWLGKRTNLNNTDWEASSSQAIGSTYAGEEAPGIATWL